MHQKDFRIFTSLILALAFALAGFIPALAAPPTNDDFGNATIIGALPFSDSVDNTEATTELFEPQTCNYSPQTVWYSFTPTANAMIRADMLGSSFGNTTLSIYQATGPGFAGLNFMACASYGSFATFTVQAGTTYYFQAGSAYSGGGDLHLNLQEIPPPPNDNFANAEIIPALPFSDTVDNTGASGELDEPQYCYTLHTVWYTFTPAADAVVRADMLGSSFGDTILNVYQATGSGFAGLNFITCASYGSFATFTVQAGTIYYFQAGSAYSGGGDMHLNLQEIPPPPNDNFANTTIISPSLPFDDTIDTSAATSEAGEPSSSCTSNGANKTAWYTFTPTTSGSVSARADSNFQSLLAVYTGNSFASLTEIGCRPWYNQPLTFQATAGTTYHFQVGDQSGNGGSLSFHLTVTPPPQAGFYYYPGDPSKFDTVQFQDNSYDPGNVGFQTSTWNFGDGSSASGFSAQHKYAADGDYEVSHTVTTADGRNASITQTVQVRTHDVAITRVTAPNSANSGQTKSITVTLRNAAYPETVQVDLYKSTPNGFVWIATVTKPVPALAGNRTTTFSFNYTFTSSDASLGKVTFKAVATIVSGRDAFPADNEAISSPPTKVGR